MTKKIWTRAEEDALRAMAAKGFSGAAIGTALGFSRASVLGKAWRLNITLTGKRTAVAPPKVIIAKAKRARAEVEKKAREAREAPKAPTPAPAAQALAPVPEKAPAPEADPSPLAVIPAPRIKPSEPGRVLLWDAGIDRCKYPTWTDPKPEPASAFVCGAPVLVTRARGGKEIRRSYCPEHHARCIAGHVNAKGEAVWIAPTSRHSRSSSKFSGGTR
jgi:hypothetical protein